MGLDIVGGSWGTSGKVEVDGDGIRVRGNGPYPFEKVEDIDYSQGDSARKVSILSVLIGVFILIPVLSFFLGLIGIGIGLLLTIFGSSFTVKGKDSAVIRFADGQRVLVEGDVDRIRKAQQGEAEKAGTFLP